MNPTACYVRRSYALCRRCSDSLTQRMGSHNSAANSNADVPVNDITICLSVSNSYPAAYSMSSPLRPWYAIVALDSVQYSVAIITAVVVLLHSLPVVPHVRLPSRAVVLHLVCLRAVVLSDWVHVRVPSPATLIGTRTDTIAQSYSGVPVRPRSTTVPHANDPLCHTVGCIHQSVDSQGRRVGIHIPELIPQLSAHHCRRHHLQVGCSLEWFLASMRQRGELGLVVLIVC